MCVGTILTEILVYNQKLSTNLKCTCVPCVRTHKNELYNCQFTRKSVLAIFSLGRIMQELSCFVCGILTNIYCKDVSSLRSKHSETKILTYLEKFIGHDLSDDVRSTSESIVCQNCIIKIDEYDEMYVNAKSLEDELRTVLLRTLEKQSLADDEAASVTDIVADLDDASEEIEEPTSIVSKPSMFCNICRKDFER